MTSDTTLRLAVTGASGFVGGAVCRTAAKAGCEVHAYGRRPHVDPDHVGGVPYQPWDITSGPLEGTPEVDAVVHCAGSVTDWGTLNEMYTVNVTGTEDVLATFRGKMRFVHVSTASVYDPRVPTVRAGEDDALDAKRHRDPYGRTKANAEAMVAWRHPNSVILRPHAVYGPGDTTLMPRLLDAIRRTPSGPRLLAVGDGRQRLSLTSIDNLVQACLLAATTPDVSGVYNIADAEPLTLDEALRAFLAARGSQATPLYLPYRVAYPAAVAAEAAARLIRGIGKTSTRPPRLTRYAVRHLAVERTLDISKARRQLGYDPEPTSFEGAADW